MKIAIPSCFALTMLFVSGCDTSESALSVSNDNYDRSIEIVNNSGRAILAIHARNETTGQWSENVLNGTVLRTGGSIETIIDDGSGACVYTLRTSRYKGRSSITDRTYNVCKIIGLTYNRS